MPTLKELSVMYAKKQPKQVDAITEDSPILSMLPFEEASHDMWNVAEEVESVTGPGFVDLDAELPIVNVATKLTKKDLSIMGGIAQVPEDTAQLSGGAPRYFSKKEPLLLRKSGETAEKAILYNMIRVHALAGSNKINAEGSSNANHSILAVRFATGECNGLYSPKGFANGAMLDVKAFNNGALMDLTYTRNGATVTVPGYKIRYKGYFGFQILSSRVVGVIYNVDRVSSTKKLPTATQIDDLLAMIRANNSSTYLFMHPKLLSNLKDIRGAGNRITVSSPDINNPVIIDRWDRIPIVTSYNFLDAAEANV
ncbi:MAG: hypothetical protein KGZ85_08000 [Ignavibacterium sp.]|nr:hypothetical protein [Ignavibacterium sp.]